MQNKRHGLRKSVKMVYGVLDALGMQTHPDKTFIGNGNKGFDFLGFAICPTGLTVSDAARSRRDNKIATLFEQGASKRRIGLYLARWLGWATLAAAAHCPAMPGSSQCGSSVSSTAPWALISINTADGALVSNEGSPGPITRCTTNTDTACTLPVPATFSDGTTFYFKNPAVPPVFFQCQYLSSVPGFSLPPQPPALPSSSPATTPFTYRVPAETSTCTGLALALCGACVLAWRRRKLHIQLQAATSKL